MLKTDKGIGSGPARSSYQERRFVHREEELTAGADHGGVKMQTKRRVSPLLMASLLAGVLQRM